MNKTYLPGNTRQRIQDLLKSRNTTQAELADIIGLSESALSRYLQGKTEMLGDGHIIKIAKHFDVSTDFLLGETNIPDRKNYDIEELGLSAEAAKLLYTGKIDANTLNMLLENPRFPTLVAMLSRYQNDVVKTGIQVMNRTFGVYHSIFMEQADTFPDNADALMQAARDVQALQTPEIEADMAAMQELFTQIAEDMKWQAPRTAPINTNMGAEAIEQIYKNLKKGQDSVDLRYVTSEKLTNAVTEMLALSGAPKWIIRGFKSLFKKLLDKTDKRKVKPA